MAVAAQGVRPEGGAAADDRVAGRGHGGRRSVAGHRIRRRADAMSSMPRSSKGLQRVRMAAIESHHRRMVVTAADMANSPRLAQLAKRLDALQRASGLTKPNMPRS